MVCDEAHQPPTALVFACAFILTRDRHHTRNNSRLFGVVQRQKLNFGVVIIDLFWKIDMHCSRKPVVKIPPYLIYTSESTLRNGSSPSWIALNTIARTIPRYSIRTRRCPVALECYSNQSHHAELTKVLLQEVSAQIYWSCHATVVVMHMHCSCLLGKHSS